MVADDRTMTLINGAGRIMATLEEIGAMFGVSKQQVWQFLQNHPDAKAAYDTGLAMGRVSLRRSNFRLAQKNSSMAIFLSVNYLGLENTGTPPAGSGGSTDPAVKGELSARERIASRIARISAAQAATPNPGEPERR